MQNNYEIPEFLPGQHDCEPGNCTPECERERLEQGGRLPATAGKTEKRQEAYNFPDCITCQRRIESGKFYGPAHTPSQFCRSGKREHCSCDFCY